MINWSNEIPDSPAGRPLPLRRTPAAGSFNAIVTSPDLTGTDTHYWGGRTVPCERPNCPACREGIGYRWHAYFGCLQAHTRAHILFEVTAQAAETFVAYRQAHGTLRGCLFSAQRWQRRPNGRVIIQTKPADLAQITLPPAPDVCAALAIIWGLSTADVHTGRDIKKMPSIVIPDERIHPEAVQTNRTRPA
jgi:hypothetical protein